MVNEESKQQLQVSVPGEWALQKVLGPVLDEVGTDLQKLYAVGRDKIVSSALRKIKNPEDGAKANLRVARDVFWNGSFTDEAICAEYFGGILASARTMDGNDDSGIYYLDIIKALSSRQLHLHYVIYHSLNKLLSATPEKQSTNPGLDRELNRLEVYFATVELDQLNLTIATDLEALFRKGLIHMYETNTTKLEDNSILPYTKASPTTLGIHLFAIAFNRFSSWQNFCKEDFGDFDSISMPRYYAFSNDFPFL